MAESSGRGAAEGLDNALVFFGHQSVGANIIDGIQENYPESYDVSSFDGGVPAASGIVHKYLGRNGYPEEKIGDFRDTLLNWPSAKKPDVAAMKFCYIDIDERTDVDGLFESYRETVEEIEKALPDTTIVHMTAPLTTRDGPVKAALKRILGRTPWGIEANANRERFNSLVREEYGGGRHLFDIAELESTKPNGRREAFTVGDDAGYALYEGYAADSGHLNEEGRKMAANAFLRLLGSVD